MFDDVEMGRNENQILGSSRTVIVCCRKMPDNAASRAFSPVCSYIQPGILTSNHRYGEKTFPISTRPGIGVSSSRDALVEVFQPG